MQPHAFALIPVMRDMLGPELQGLHTNVALNLIPIMPAAFLSEPVLEPVNDHTAAL